MQQLLQRGVSGAGVPLRPMLERKVALSVGVLRYYLLEEEGEALFYLRVSLGQEKREACLGHDFARAAAIFDLLLSHSVTPCTLDDVLQDIAFAEEAKNRVF